MIERPLVDGFGRKRFTFVLGVSWLATDLRLSLALGGGLGGLTMSEEGAWRMWKNPCAPRRVVSAASESGEAPRTAIRRD